MIFINKFPPPQELKQLKQLAEAKGLTENEAYKMLRNPLKGKVRDSLVKEQGHLCAYCMRRIPDERILPDDTNLSDTYIEHWQARSLQDTGSSNKSLDYNNMLAVCSGNEKINKGPGRHKRRFLTCDKKRGNQPLKVNPLDANTLATIYYLSDGTIQSTDNVINNDIDGILNLNCNEEAVTLPQSRKAVLDAVQESLVNQEGDFITNCREQLRIWESEEDPKTPYIGIVIWWLREQLK